MELDRCIICFSNDSILFNKSKSFINCRCSSVLFHESCWKQFCSIHNKCPLCRSYLRGTQSHLFKEDDLLLWYISTGLIVNVLICILIVLGLGSLTNTITDVRTFGFMLAFLASNIAFILETIDVSLVWIYVNHHRYRIVFGLHFWIAFLISHGTVLAGCITSNHFYLFSAMIVTFFYIYSPVLAFLILKIFTHVF